MASILKVDQIQLPDGSAPTASDLGVSTGQVIVSNNTSPMTTTSTSYVSSGWEVSITPTSTTSNVLVDVSLEVATTDGTYAVYRVYRKIGSGSYVEVSPRSSQQLRDERQNGFLHTSYHTADGTNFDLVTNIVSGCFIDNPSTTDSVTYAIFFVSRINVGSTAYINRMQRSAAYAADATYGSAGASSIKLTELFN